MGAIPLMRWAKNLTPGPLRRRAGRLLAPWTVARWEAKAREAWDITGGQVTAGPFRGLTYIDQAGGSTLGPKLLGTYECELIPTVRAILDRGPGRIIDIGAAEGYYAVGLAVRLPETRVVAFEASAKSQALLRKLAEANGVTGRIDLHGACDPGALVAVFAQADAGPQPDRPVVICDIEGAEAEVLDPEAVPGLIRCDILVELHDMYRPGVSALIRDRFTPTHTIKTIDSRPRTTNDLPSGITGTNPKRLLQLADELRKEPMQWYWMRSNEKPPTL